MRARSGAGVGIRAACAGAGRFATGGTAPGRVIRARGAGQVIEVVTRGQRGLSARARSGARSLISLARRVRARGERGRMAASGMAWHKAGPRARGAGCRDRDGRSEGLSARAERGLSWGFSALEREPGYPRAGGAVAIARTVEEVWRGLSARAERGAAGSSGRRAGAGYPRRAEVGWSMMGLSARARSGARSPPRSLCSTGVIRARRAGPARGRASSIASGLSARARSGATAQRVNSPRSGVIRARGSECPRSGRGPACPGLSARARKRGAQSPRPAARLGVIRARGSGGLGPGGLPLAPGVIRARGAGHLDEASPHLHVGLSARAERGGEWR